MIRLLSLFIIISGFSGIFSPAKSQTIITIAGTGASGFSGDGQPATAAVFRDIYDVAIDNNGNILIADCSNSRIRKIDAVTGIISTIAGNSNTIGGGFSGDGGLATQAQLSFPYSIAVDTANNIFVADNSNNRIRKIDAVTGIITTVAGTGAYDYTGDGGQAVNATLKRPRAITIDKSNNIYICDFGNHCIRKVNSSTGVITTIAGTGTAGFSGDDGPAVAADLNSPFGMALDTSNNLFVADLQNQRIRKIDLSSGLISTYAGTGYTDSTGYGSFSGDGGPAILAELNQPHALEFDREGYLFFADDKARRIRRISPAGTISTVAGNGVAGFAGDGGPALMASFKGINGMCFNQQNELFVADVLNQRIRKIYDIPSIISIVAKEYTIDVYPQPAGNFLKVAIDSKEYDLITLVDAIGQTVITSAIEADANGKSVTIDVSELPGGMYMAILTGPKVVTSKRLMIQH
ncbi:MAG TPA: T9SS type A sorting domain-containing protein [Chitinophagales bacterium]|nr:T9SS type A sorting domain-containing protein [Chitinophagales bacterium]